MSEANLNRTRIFVEIQWLIHLTNLGALGASPVCRNSTKITHNSIYIFSTRCRTNQKIEQQTKHDVKAVEYFLQDRLKQLGLSHLQDLLHFACTSEDINNLSYAINIRNALECAWLPESEQLIQNIKISHNQMPKQPCYRSHTASLPLQPHSVRSLPSMHTDLQNYT